MRILPPLAASAILICVLALANPLRPVGWPDVIVAADTGALDVERLAQLPDVSDAVAVRQGQVTLRTEGSGSVNMVLTATHIGVDAADLARVQAPVSVAVGSWYHSSGEVTIGSLVATTLRLDVGDQLVVGSRSLSVAGILARSMTQMDSAILLGPADVPDTSAAYAYLFLKPQGTLAAATRDIRSLGLRVESDPFHSMGEDRRVLLAKIVAVLSMTAFLIWSTVRASAQDAGATAGMGKLWRRYLVGLAAGMVVALLLVYALNSALLSIGFPLFRVTWLTATLTGGVVIGSGALVAALGRLRQRRGAFLA